MSLLRIAAFADGDQGGNPAGVLIAETLPDAAEMQTIARELGYSETAFAAPEGDAWRVRYFAPESEVPFCGHATIALGAALSDKFGEGVYDLILNEAQITVEGWQDSGRTRAALQSPPTRSEPISDSLLSEVLELFGYSCDDLDSRIPPARAHGGADHLVLTLASRQRLAEMRYDLDAGRRLMNREGLVTILFAWAETTNTFHTRNPFASGGVYEDPATGAATAAFAGYLRDLDWPHGGSIHVIQGEDMGSRSQLQASIPPGRGDSIRVSGTARSLD